MPEVMRFSVLGSGSSGNAALLVTDDSRVLIDAGFSPRKLSQLVHAAGHPLESLQAIFLTHEHGDHAAGIEVLKKHPHIEVFANAATARAIQDKLDFKPTWRIFQTGSRFTFRDLEIDAFAVPHDAQDPVGFTFASGTAAAHRRLAWLTDLGHAPRHILERLRGLHAIAVEANHCPRLLQADIRRPWSTKQRIAGRHGHLSNDAVRELLETVAGPDLRHVVLTHLSRDCNTPDAVSQALAGLRARLACTFSIVAQGEQTPFLDLD
jgi:phosphoribosyl 1,2-cyclic phosphodiesterase